jgi:inosine-uridine nucleoside N-ribohydrolase
MRVPRILVGTVTAAGLLVSASMMPGAVGAAVEPTAHTAAQTTKSTAEPKAQTPSKEKVIIDSDMGQLNDDAAAMFLLAQSDRTVDLLGVTTVSGNTWVEEGTAYSLRQLEIAKEQRIPVVPGAGVPLMGDRQPTLAAEEDLFGNSQYIGSLARPRPESYQDLATPPYGGYPKLKPSTDAAAAFIAKQVRAHPHEVTIFALGPATNIALAVRTYPDIVPLVKEVIYMGGAIDIPGNTTPAAEFNWWYDPEAASVALRTPFPKQTVVPNDVAERVFYTKAEYDRIVGGPETPITKMFKDLQGPGFESNPDRSSFVWDSLTAAIFLDRSIATDVQERYLDVDDTYGSDYGRALGYDESRRRDLDNPDDFPTGTQKVGVVFDINRERFWNLYVDLMTAPVTP